MSRMIPQETVNALRNFNDVSVDMYGIDCKLFIPGNQTVLESTDVYRKVEELTYEGLDAKVFIEWSPNAKRLRKLGIYTEDDIPLLGWFKNMPDIKTSAYIKVPIQYVPGIYDTDEFEVTNIVLKGMHDAEALKAYKLVPRRVK